MTWTYDLYSEVDNVQNTVEGPRSEWDTVILNNLPVIGVAKVSASVDTGLDTQKAKGAKRAYIVDNGSSPIKFTITVELQPGELAEFARSTVPIIRPPSKNGGQPKVQISHPEAALWGVSSIKITSVNSSPPASGGTKTIVIKAVEDVGFAPVKKKKPAKKLSQQELGDLQDANLTIALRNDLFAADREKAGF